MKSFLATLIFATPLLGFGITSETIESFSSPILEAEEPRTTTGYIDANGKQGFFVIYGKDMPEKVGYAPDARIEEGNFKDNRKIGEWIMYHTDGITPRLKGNFVDGRPNGPYVKFDDKGNKTEESSYNKGKQSGTFITYYSDGTVKQEKTFNADGKEDGTIKFYYPDGTLQYSGTAVNGVATGEGIRYWEDGSVKEIVTYAADGTVASTKVVNAEPSVAVKTEIGTGGPSGANGILKDGTKFKADGYNKLYNKAEDLWMDGTFKGGKLWEGKLYKYDSDGILLKIEIWKNGAYHSDGQL